MAGAPSTGQARVRYFAVWAALQSHPKWMPLSMEARGAWTTLAIIACSSEPRGAFRDRAHAEMLLRRDGAADPPALVAQLIEAGLLDEDDEGLRFHDWSEWQRKPSDMPDAIAARVRRHRNGGVTETRRGVTADVTPQKEGGRRALSESSTPDGASEGAAVVDQGETIPQLLEAIEVWLGRPPRSNERMAMLSLLPYDDEAEGVEWALAMLDLDPAGSREHHPIAWLLWQDSNSGLTFDDWAVHSEKLSAAGIEPYLDGRPPGSRSLRSNGRALAVGA